MSGMADALLEEESLVLIILGCAGLKAAARYARVACRERNTVQESATDVVPAGHRRLRVSHVFLSETKLRETKQPPELLLRHVAPSTLERLSVEGTAVGCLSLFFRLAGAADSGALTLRDFVFSEVERRMDDEVAVKWAEALVACAWALCQAGLQNLTLLVRDRPGGLLSDDWRRLVEALAEGPALHCVEVLSAGNHALTRLLAKRGWTRRGDTELIERGTEALPPRSHRRQPWRYAYLDHDPPVEGDEDDEGGEDAEDFFRRHEVSVLQGSGVTGCKADLVHTLWRFAGLGDGGALSLREFYIDEYTDPEGSPSVMEWLWVEALVACVASLVENGLEQMRLRLFDGFPEKLIDSMAGSKTLCKLKIFGQGMRTVERVLRKDGWQVQHLMRPYVHIQALPIRGAAQDGPQLLDRDLGHRVLAGSLLREWEGGHFREGHPDCIPHMRATYVKAWTLEQASAGVAWPLVQPPDAFRKLSRTRKVECNLVHVPPDYLSRLSKWSKIMNWHNILTAGDSDRVFFFLNVERFADRTNDDKGPYVMAVSEHDDALGGSAKYRLFYCHGCGGDFPNGCNGTCGNNTGETANCKGWWQQYKTGRVTNMLLSEAIDAL